MARPRKTDDKISPLGQELIEAAQAMLAHVKGELELPTYSYPIPDKVDVKKIRNAMHLTQDQFAHYIGASVSAIRHWERGRRKPDGPARTLLFVLENNPRAILEAIHHHESHPEA